MQTIIFFNLFYSMTMNYFEIIFVSFAELVSSHKWDYIHEGKFYQLL